MATILHFGFPKTGTTFLQQFFRRNAAALKQAGIAYPLPDKDFKQRALKHLVAKTPSPSRSDELFRLRDTLDAEWACAPDVNILLSVEEISSPLMSRIRPDTVAAIRDFIHRDGHPVRLLVYVRRPEDFYLSMMQEKFKRSGGLVPPADFRTDFAAIIRIYEEAFETRAIVRPFERQQWREGDLLVDFFDQIRDLADVDVAALSPPAGRANESLSAETMFALDLLRRFPDSMTEKHLYSFAESERLWRKLRDIAEEAGYTRKPRLFAPVAETVAAANRHDADELLSRYGVRFHTRPEVSDDPPPPDTGRLSDLEGILPLNRDHALRLISVLCARENAYRLKNI